MPWTQSARVMLTCFEWNTVYSPMFSMYWESNAIIVCHLEASKYEKQWYKIILRFQTNTITCGLVFCLLFYPGHRAYIKENETQHSFAELLNIYISGIWLWYMQALFINRVKQNRCLKSENPQPMVVTILPPCSGKQMWMWCSVVSSLLDGS